MNDLIIDDIPDEVFAKLAAAAEANGRTVEDEAIAVIVETLNREEAARSAKPMLKLWGRTNSINVQKVVWCLEELGLAYERVDAGGPFGVVDTPAYRTLNPNGRVPVIEEDGFVLWESNAIVRYLAAKHDPGGLWPTDLRERADADRWMDWQTTAFSQAVLVAFHGLVRTPPEKRDHAAIEASLAQGEAMARILDAHLATRPFVAGERFTMGDIAAGAAGHRWLHLAPNRTRLPHVERWYAALIARPAASKTLTAPLT